MSEMTLYDYLKDYKKEDIDIAVTFLDSSYFYLLKDFCGEDLSSPIKFYGFEDDDWGCFYYDLLPRIKKILTDGNYREKYKLLNENETNLQRKKSCSTMDTSTSIKSIVYPSLDQLSEVFSIKELIVALLTFGYIDSKFYRKEEVAEFLNIDLADVNYITRMTEILFKKVNSNQLITDTDNKDIKVKKLL